VVEELLLLLLLLFPASLLSLRGEEVRASRLRKLLCAGEVRGQCHR